MAQHQQQLQEVHRTCGCQKSAIGSIQVQLLDVENKMVVVNFLGRLGVLLVNAYVSYKIYMVDKGLVPLLQ